MGWFWRGREVIYNLFQKFQMRHEGFSFYWPQIFRWWRWHRSNIKLLLALSLLYLPKRLQLVYCSLYITIKFNQGVYTDLTARKLDKSNYSHVIICILLKKKDRAYNWLLLRNRALEAQRVKGKLFNALCKVKVIEGGGMRVWCQHIEYYL